jgi:hypothetical protein
MKKLIFTIALFVASFISKATDTERFMQAMGQTLMELGQAKDVASLQEVANKFERIASSETTEWLPNYYAGLSYTLIAMKQKDTSPDEVEVIKAQNFMMRISVDGPARWMKFGSAFEGAIAKAKEINPANPRAYALKAMMVYNTPEQFGGGSEKACPEVQEAIAKFTNFKPTSPIAPNWGAEQMKGMVCK